MIYSVIMAGGAGTRFWPLSRNEKPKQFLKLFSEKTLIQETVARLDDYIPRENVMVVTNEQYTELVKNQVPDLLPERLIGEPMARNTAPCIAAAAALLLADDPDATMIVMPADHQVADVEEMLDVFRAAVEVANRERVLVTIGIEPNRPETGYGYIQREMNPHYHAADKGVHKVIQFTEKPNLEKAEGFVKSGEYLWNSGIFIWRADAVAEAFRSYLPGLYEEMMILQNSSRSDADIRRFYENCPSVSIDVGIMEKAQNVYVIPADFGWNDIGGWKAVHELSSKDPSGNASLDARTVYIRSKDNLVHSGSGKLVTLIGVENLAVVETEDAVMVLNLDDAQAVRVLVEHFKKEGQNEFL